MRTPNMGQRRVRLGLHALAIMPELPPYTRKVVIGGYPDALITAPMLALGERKQIVGLFRWLMWHVLMQVNQVDTCPLPPFGTFRKVHYAARNYISPHTGLPGVSNPSTRMAWRPSEKLRLAILGKSYPHQETLPEILAPAAVDAGLTPLQAEALWPVMAGRMFAALAANDTIRVRGIGWFHLVIHRARYYRDWRTGTLTLRKAHPVARMAYSPSATGWLTAGIIPAPTL